MKTPLLLMLPLCLFLLIAVQISCGGSGSTGQNNLDGISGQDQTGDQLTASDGAVIGPCEEGDRICINGMKAECSLEYGWLLTPCLEGTSCEDGECVASACFPLSSQCSDNGVQICSPDGSGWSKPMACPQGHTCLEGICIAPDCTKGDLMCAGDMVLTCTDAGIWNVTPCTQGEFCLEGRCIECIQDEDCGDLVCDQGICLEQTLEILTPSMPDGVVGQVYQLTFQAQGGESPYIWTLEDGILPLGLTMSPEGVVSGTPTEAGSFSLSVMVEDNQELADSALFSFDVIENAMGELVITTGSPLPGGEEGTPYQTGIQASGGTPPYFWGVTQGALPAGLSLGSDGLISGTPADHGEFLFTIKAFDNGQPTASGQKDFSLTISIAPLEIIGDQEYDIWVTKIIILPLLTALEGIPLPYSTDLKAKGGVKPYHWSEQPLPSFVSFLIPNGGLPSGLTLSDNGQLHGSVTDTSEAISITVPFTQISLTGFFFMGKVQDSQNPADSAEAIYLIPTIPLGF